MKRAELGVWEVVLFSIPKEIVYSFYFLLDIFWVTIYLTYVPQFGQADLVYDYLFSTQSESHPVADMDFFIIPSPLLSQLELLRIELPKFTPSILIENCDHSICPGWWILFLYAPAHKVWLLKNLFPRCIFI